MLEQLWMTMQWKLIRSQTDTNIINMILLQWRKTVELIINGIDDIN